MLILASANPNRLAELSNAILLLRSYFKPNHTEQFMSCAQCFLVACSPSLSLFPVAVEMLLLDLVWFVSLVSSSSFISPLHGLHFAFILCQQLDLRPMICSNFSRLWMRFRFNIWLLLAFRTEAAGSFSANDSVWFGLRSLFLLLLTCYSHRPQTKHFNNIVQKLYIFFLLRLLFGSTGIRYSVLISSIFKQYSNERTYVTDRRKTIKIPSACRTGGGACHLLCIKMQFTCNAFRARTKPQKGKT